MPKVGTRPIKEPCKACEGTGRSSTNRPCVPCAGSGIQGKVKADAKAIQERVK